MPGNHPAQPARSRLAVSTRLVPTMRVVVHDAGADAGQRIRTCLAGFVHDPQLLDQLMTTVDPSAALFDVADPAPLYAKLTQQQRVATRTSSATLGKLLEPVLAPPLGEVTSQQITCLATGVEQRPVVLVRETAAVTEQYLFLGVTVNTSTGRIQFQPAAGPAHRGVVAHESGWQTGQQIVGAAMAVTPFLPAPFGPIATGALSFINLVFGLAQDGQPATKSPLDQAVASIENFVNDTALKGYAGAISAQTGEFTHALNAQSQDINALSTIDGGISDLRDNTQYTWIPGVVTPNGQLYTFLKTCDVTNYDKTLSLLVSGITTELVMYHALVAVNATDASIQYRHRSLQKYGSAVTKVTGAAGTASGDIGQSHQGDWTDDELKATIDDDTAPYIPRIEAWMAKARKDRMDQISDLIRIDPYKDKKQDPEGYDVSTVHVGGWTFTDSSVGSDNGRLANVVWDTETDGCSPTTTEQKTLAQTKLDTYRNTIANGIDSGFAAHRDKMASWTTYLTAVTDLLPPGLPPIPTATLTSSGTATPAGDWNSGDQVRYALMAKSKHGPSPASDWCDPLTVGGFVGATVSGIKSVQGAESIVVLRQFRPHGGTWSDTEQVTALSAPFPSTYLDTSQGGDPW